MFEGHTPYGNPSSDPGRPRPVRPEENFNDLLLELYYFSERFSQFVPALYPPNPPHFLDRLVNWVNNRGLTSKQKRLLFEFALRLLYFTFEDFIQLYRNTFIGPVTRWIIDELALGLGDPDFAARIDRERLRRTWYCPVTDSMVISEFYHANNISGIDHRPAFRPLSHFSSANRLKEYMNRMGLVRLVLIEDFVATGVQSIKVVRWALKGLKCPVLFVPLISCPEALAKFRRMEREYSHFTFEPAFSLDDSAFVTSPASSEDPLLVAVRAFANKVHPRIAGKPDPTYGPLGFGDTGAIVVLFSNTPDNTLPLVHHQARPPRTWKPLFPRVSRETS